MHLTSDSSSSPVFVRSVERVLSQLGVRLSISHNTCSTPAQHLLNNCSTSARYQPHEKSQGCPARLWTTALELLSRRRSTSGQHVYKKYMRYAGRQRARDGFPSDLSFFNTLPSTCSTTQPKSFHRSCTASYRADASLHEQMPSSSNAIRSS